MYLNEAPAVADLLAIPADVTQICLFPVAYSIGVDFSPSTRRHPAREIAYFDRYGHTRLADGPAVVAETDVKARPDLVRAELESRTTTAEMRIDVELIPGGSRVRVHAAADDRPDDTLAELRGWLADVAARAEAAGGRP